VISSASSGPAGCSENAMVDERGISQSFQVHFKYLSSTLHMGSHLQSAETAASH